MVMPVLAAAAPSMIGNLVGGLFGRSSAKKQASQQAALQREFAQNGIRWKVEDAKAAGIHPLYALGAQTNSYQPIAIDDPMGNALSNMGQDVSRAIQAQATPEEKAIRTLQMQQAAENIAKTQAERDYIYAQIAKLNQSDNQSGGLPSELPTLQSGPQTGAQTGRAKIVPAEVTSARPGAPQLTAGPDNPTFQAHSLGPDGMKIAIPQGTSMSEAFENIAAYPAIVRESARLSNMSSGEWLFQFITGNKSYWDYIMGPPKDFFPKKRKGGGASGSW